MIAFAFMLLVFVWVVGMFGMMVVSDVVDDARSDFIGERILPVWAFGGFGLIVVCYLVVMALTVYGAAS